MQISVSLPSKGYVEKLVLYNVPGGATFQFDAMEIPLNPGTQVIDFAKMLKNLKQTLQAGQNFPFTLENGHCNVNMALLYWAAGIRDAKINSTYDYESANFRGLKMGREMWCCIRTIGPEYNYKMYWKGKEAHSGRESVIRFPDFYIDRMEIERVPVGAKLIFLENIFMDLAPGKAIINFRDILQVIKRKKQWRHAHMDVNEVDIPKEYALTTNEWMLSIMIGFAENHMVDWKSSRWDGINGQIARNYLGNDKTMKIRVYPTAPIKCEYYLVDPV